MEETIERLKGWVKAGAWLTVGLLILFVALKITFWLFAMLIPALFVGGAVYLGYRWWQRKIAPPDDRDYYDIEIERERRKRW